MENAREDYRCDDELSESKDGENTVIDLLSSRKGKDTGGCDEEKLGMSRIATGT
jgi:hypothetical protein